MGLLEALLSIMIPIVAVIFLIAGIYSWCGKTQGIRAGVKKVLEEVSVLFGKDDNTVRSHQYYDIDEREFVGLKNRISEFFSYFVFINARNFGTYLAVQYKAGTMQVGEEVIECEWVNFLKTTFNIPNHIKIPVLVFYDSQAGLLYLYYAWCEGGIATLEEIRSNIKSRQIPPLSDDLTF